MKNKIKVVAVLTTIVTLAMILMIFEYNLPKPIKVVPTPDIPIVLESAKTSSD